MPAFLIPVVLGASLPVTATFLGATVYTNLINPGHSNYWSVQSKAGRWVNLSLEKSKNVDNELECATEDKPVGRIIIEEEEHYIDFMQMQLVRPVASESFESEEEEKFEPYELPRRVRRKPRPRKV